MDIDILIGERPGGMFNALLRYQKKGEIYPLNGRGDILLPLFQVAPFQMTNTTFLPDRPIWRC